jgi:REP-associated tyrosine transposase
MPGDSQSLTFPGIYESPSNVNRSKFTEREAFMSNAQNLSHTKWECKYHLTWIPKYRRNELYGDLRKYLGEVLRELARRKECEILEGHLMPDHAHMLISIPPKYAISQVVGFIKGKSAIHVAREFFGRRKNFTGEEFWARGYHVSTVGKNEDAIRKYIKEQEREDRRIDQLKLY